MDSVVDCFDSRQTLAAALVMTDADVVDPRQTGVGLAEPVISGVMKCIHKWQPRQAFAPQPYGAVEMDNITGTKSMLNGPRRVLNFFYRGRNCRLSSAATANARITSASRLQSE